MKLYRVECSPDDKESPFITWVGNQADMAIAKRKMMEDHDVKRSEVEAEEVDVPTSKKELLAFLNDNSV